MNMFGNSKNTLVKKKVTVHGKNGDYQAFRNTKANEEISTPREKKNRSGKTGSKQNFVPKRKITRRDSKRKRNFKKAFGIRISIKRTKKNLRKWSQTSQTRYGDESICKGSRKRRRYACKNQRSGKGREKCRL